MDVFDVDVGWVIMCVELFVFELHIYLNTIVTTYSLSGVSFGSANLVSSPARVSFWLGLGWR